MKISDFIADRLLELGVRHVFGVGGANIEDMFAAVQRRRPLIRMVLSKHEHAAGTAADAHPRVTGNLGVVFATSGGGAMNLVHARGRGARAGCAATRDRGRALHPLSKGTTTVSRGTDEDH